MFVSSNDPCAKRKLLTQAEIQPLVAQLKNIVEEQPVEAGKKNLYPIYKYVHHNDVTVHPA